MRSGTSFSWIQDYLWDKFHLKTLRTLKYFFWPHVFCNWMMPVLWCFAQTQGHSRQGSAHGRNVYNPFWGHSLQLCCWVSPNSHHVCLAITLSHPLQNFDMHAMQWTLSETRQTHPSYSHDNFSWKQQEAFRKYLTSRGFGHSVTVQRHQWKSESVTDLPTNQRTPRGRC